MPSRVEILLGPHQVVVEAAAALETVTAAALRLWRDTTDPATAGEPLGFTGAAIVSDPVSQPLMGLEIPLPSQLNPQEGIDDRR